MKIVICWISQVIGNNGGMEKVMINFSNEMARRGHKVTLAYCTEFDGDFCSPVDENINITNLVKFMPGHKFESVKKPLSFKVLREIIRVICPTMARDMNVKLVIKQLAPAISRILQIEKPDIIISLDPRTTTIIRGTDKHGCYPIISMSHFDADTILHYLSHLERDTLNNCDAVQALMPKDVKKFKTIWPDVAVVRIPNIVPQYELGGGLRELCIVDVARLDKVQKRQHLLIETFSLLADQFSDWTVEFWGDENGKSKYTDELKELIRKYHLEGHVKLCGRTDDVLSVYRRASIFAFPSAYEGFGLAMAEAMSAGLPVVAYRSCPAVNELVRDGETGLLVDDGVEALAEGLKKLMKNQELRERMGRAAHESMKEFAPEKIWDQWEALMKDVISKHKTKMER